MTDFAPPTAPVDIALRRLRRALAAAAFAVVAPAALAAPCAGFVDVDSTSPFCPSVEWIKNRGITTGCAVASSYCPDSVVDRLAMAAFLRRLGDALTPVDLAPVTAAAATIVFPPNPAVPICVTPDFNVANFPRRAYVNAQAVLSAPTASIDLEVSAVYSTTGEPAGRTSAPSSTRRSTPERRPPTGPRFRPTAGRTSPSARTCASASA